MGRTTETTTTATADGQLRGISGALMKCQQSGKFSDLTLICEGEEFKVHKVVVCSQSVVLDTACTSQFKEGSSGVYEFVDLSKVLVRKLVSFLYTGDYDGEFDPFEANMSILQLHARMFALAEQYCIDDLQPLCVKKYEERLRASESIEFLKSVPDVYLLTPEPVKELRLVAARHARGTISNFLRGQNKEEGKAAYDEAMQTAPAFAKDLLDLYVDGSSHGYGYVY